MTIKQIVRAYQELKRRSEFGSGYQAAVKRLTVLINQRIADEPPQGSDYTVRIIEIK